MSWTGRSTPVEIEKYKRIAIFDGYRGDSDDSAQHAARNFFIERLRAQHLMRRSRKVLLINVVGGVSGGGRAAAALPASCAVGGGSRAVTRSSVPCDQSAVKVMATPFMQ